MSNKKECAIVQDLLPLYVDGVVSEPSKEYIEEHLRECDDCKIHIEGLKEPMGEEAKKKQELTAKQYKKGIAYFKHRQILKILLIVVLIGMSLYSGIQIKHKYQLDKLTSGWKYNGEDVISFDEYNSVIFDEKFNEFVNEEIKDNTVDFKWNGYGFYSVEWSFWGNIIRVNKENHSMEMMFRFKGDQLILDFGDNQEIALNKE